jgi:molybdopterin-guanine dinucleotide biosynthesis protein A
METSHLVVLAVDMPFVPREQMRLLCTMVSEGSGVVPVIRERAEPLAAIYPKESAPDFSAALTGPDLSLQPLVRKLLAEGKLRMFSVPKEDEAFYRSVNTPEDF